MKYQAAFPYVIPNEGGEAGMTLRDYFAAQISVSLVLNGESFEIASKQAYEFADAMLTVRERRES